MTTEYANHNPAAVSSDNDNVYSSAMVQQIKITSDHFFFFKKKKKKKKRRTDSEEFVI